MEGYAATEALRNAGATEEMLAAAIKADRRQDSREQSQRLVAGNRPRKLQPSRMLSANIAAVLS